MKSTNKKEKKNRIKRVSGVELLRQWKQSAEQKNFVRGEDEENFERVLVLE
jgi:hypothetical protein